MDGFAHGIADTFTFGVAGKLGGLSTRGGGRGGPDHLCINRQFAFPLLILWIFVSDQV